MPQRKDPYGPYKGELVYRPRQGCWVLTVAPQHGLTQYPVQPRGVFEQGKLESHLRLVRVPFTDVTFADYACEIVRRPGGNSMAETKRLALLLRTRYIRHQGWPVSWQWRVDYNA